MYEVKIKNGTTERKIHGRKNKLSRGTVVQGINTIDSFSFTITPANPHFDYLYDLKTIVEVYNTRKERYEFQGRVLFSADSMDESGQISKDVTCESFFGFLCDSQQAYVKQKSWVIFDLWKHIISSHNSFLESYKHFKVGRFEVVDKEQRADFEIQYENTWETIKKLFLDVYGGEIRFRVEEDGIYIDYVEEFGETKTTEIALSKNMKAITREANPSEIITRLVPLGANIVVNGVETDERVDISSRTEGGVKYIDNETLVQRYGVHVGYAEYPYITDPYQLYRVATMNFKTSIPVKYSITALDLSLIGLDIEDFEVCNYYPVKNKLLNIDDTVRIVKKTIDVCEEVKSAIEVGDSFVKMSGLIGKQSGSIQKIAADVSQKVDKSDNDQVARMLNASTTPIVLSSDRVAIDNTYFELTEEGRVTAKRGEIGGWEITDYGIEKTTAEGLTYGFEVPNGGSTNVFAIASPQKDSWFDAPFRVTKDGILYVKEANIGKWMATEDGFVATVYDSNGSEVGIFALNTPDPRNTAEAFISCTNAAADDMHPVFRVGVDGKVTAAEYWTNSGVEVTSDRNLKNTITDIGEKYRVFFDNLRAVTHKYNDSRSDRIHVGFIAQEVDEALTKAGMTRQDFAGVCIENEGTDKERWSLRYTEFIPLMVKEIQELKETVRQLKQKLNEET